MSIISDWVPACADPSAAVPASKLSARLILGIAVAASGIGVPLLGDPVYGDGKGARRTLLHAAALEVPREGKPPILAMAPLPADFAALGFADNG
jgi:hypothetical protein